MFMKGSMFRWSSFFILPFFLIMPSLANNNKEDIALISMQSMYCKQDLKGNKNKNIFVKNIEYSNEYRRYNELKDTKNANKYRDMGIALIQKSIKNKNCILSDKIKRVYVIKEEPLKNSDNNNSFSLVYFNFGDKSDKNTYITLKRSLLISSPKDESMKPKLPLDIKNQKTIPTPSSKKDKNTS